MNSETTLEIYIYLIFICAINTYINLEMKIVISSVFVWLIGYIVYRSSLSKYISSTLEPLSQPKPHFSNIVITDAPDNIFHFIQVYEMMLILLYS